MILELAGSQTTPTLKLIRPTYLSLYVHDTACTIFVLTYSSNSVRQLFLSVLAKLLSVTRYLSLTESNCGYVSGRTLNLSN